MSPRETSISSLKRRATLMVGNAASTSPSKVSMPATVVRWPLGRTTTSEPGQITPPATWPRVAAVVVVGVAHRADHPLHREADVVEVAVLGDDDVLEVVEQRRGAVPLHGVRAVDHVVAVQRRDRDEGDVGDLEARRPVGDLLQDAVEDVLVVVDEVHLVHAHDEMGDPQQRGDVHVAPGLLRHALAGVDEHDRHVRGGGAGDHVARVLLVARGVGDDELAPRAWRSSGRRRRW